MLKGTKLRVIKSKYFRAYQGRYSARDTYNLTQELFPSGFLLNKAAMNIGV